MKLGMCYWRFKHAANKEWRFGYATEAIGGLYRMGLWAGDKTNGPLVDPKDIETRKYQ